MLFHYTPLERLSYVRSNDDGRTRPCPVRPPKTHGFRFPLGFVPLGFIPLGLVPLGLVPLGLVPLGLVPLGLVPLGLVPFGFMSPPGAVPFGFVLVLVFVPWRRREGVPVSLAVPDVPPIVEPFVLPMEEPDGAAGAVSDVPPVPPVPPAEPPPACAAAKPASPRLRTPTAIHR